MALLNRDGLLKKQVLKIERVELEDGDHTFVKQMNGKARDTFERSMLLEVKDEKSGRVTDYERSIVNFRAKLAVCTICDEAGKLQLKPGDAEALSENMSIVRLEKIVEASQKLNAISDEDRENLVKN